MEFTKRTNNHIFAHIYEHAYMILVGEQLRAAGFCAVVDYDISATTTDGEIEIIAESYTKSLNFASIFDAANQQPFDESLTVRATTQVKCEYRCELAAEVDGHELHSQLTAFHTHPWNTDEVFAPGFTLDEGDEMTIRSVAISTHYPAERTELWPLFRLYAGAILNEIADQIADEFGGFVDTEAYHTDADNNLSMMVLVPAATDVSQLTEYVETARQRLVESGVGERLCEQLQQVESMTHPPRAEFAHESVSVQIDADRWRQVATLANIAKLDEALTVTTTSD